jgi:glycosyltransferase involved in cell wall biosynthesis
MGPPENAAQPCRPRVLLLTAACNPYKGSDFAVGWGRGLESAKRFDTWAICGDWDREDINRFIAKNGEIPGLHFCFLERSWFEEFLNQGRPLYDIHYLPYNLWHRRAYRLAASLHQQLRFALVHQITRVTFREPGYLWKLEAPFLWGPVGGTQNFPWRFLGLVGAAGALKEIARTLINIFWLRFSPRVRQAIRKASLVMAANRQIQRDFQKAHGFKPLLLLETGINTVKRKNVKKNRENSPLRILWSGKFEHYKALPLLFRALAALPPGIRYELKILGDGPLRRRWQKLARGLGLEDRCQWVGWLPHQEAMRYYDWADVLVFTSLRDTSGNVVLEALSCGVPVICLDHQGVGDIVTPECGVKIPVTTPKGVIAQLLRAIISLAEDRTQLRSMSLAAIKRARQYLWSHNAEEMARIYYAVLQGSRPGGGVKNCLDAAQG